MTIESGSAMSIVNGFPINFSLSAAAHDRMLLLRREMSKLYRDPPDYVNVAMIGWGVTELNSGERSGNVLVSFYAHSQRAELSGAIERLGDLDIVFFVTEQNYSRFQDKILDYADNRWFFLRDP